MTGLRELQTLVRDAVFATAQDDSALKAVSEHINASPGIAADEHLLIYRRAILGTLVRALESIYPVCKRLVGEQFFAAMARIYARQTPSLSPDLADYGEQFDAFIADFAPAATLPYLPDMARLEWHWHRAFHAADEGALDLTALGNISPDAMADIVFSLPVSATLLQSDFPVHRIWQVNQADWQGDQELTLDAGGVRLIIWRRQYEMRIDELDADAWQLLNAIARQASFGELSELPAAATLDTLLARCVRHGWISSFTPATGVPG